MLFDPIRGLTLPIVPIFAIDLRTLRVQLSAEMKKATNRGLICVAREGKSETLPETIHPASEPLIGDDLTFKPEEGQPHKTGKLLILGYQVREVKVINLKNFIPKRSN